MGQFMPSVIYSGSSLPKLEPVKGKTSLLSCKTGKLCVCDCTSPASETSRAGELIPSLWEGWSVFPPVPSTKGRKGYQGRRRKGSCDWIHDHSKVTSYMQATFFASVWFLCSSAHPWLASLCTWKRKVLGVSCSLEKMVQHSLRKGGFSFSRGTLEYECEEGMDPCLLPWRHPKEAPLWLRRLPLAIPLVACDATYCCGKKQLGQVMGDCDGGADLFGQLPSWNGKSLFGNMIADKELGSLPEPCKG